MVDLPQADHGRGTWGLEPAARRVPWFHASMIHSARLRGAEASRAVVQIYDILSFSILGVYLFLNG
jgi:hypothetical protein